MNKVWLTASSVLLGLSFIFRNAIRITFENVVFLFVVHPFDVGDVLMLEEPGDRGAGQQYCQVAAPAPISRARVVEGTASEEGIKKKVRGVRPAALPD